MAKEDLEGPAAPGKDVERLASQFAYLDGLRKSGTTNMFGAGPWLASRFCMSREEAYPILSVWMKLDLDKSPLERAQSAEARHLLTARSAASTTP